MLNRYVSGNGIRILHEYIPTVRSATIGIWIATGSRDENKDNNGISHFIEHMLFKGTKNRSARSIAESFDRIGGQVNAFTSKEYTCLYAKVLDEHTSFALEVLSDMLMGSVFDEVELEKEKQVVGEEIKMYEDTPDDHVHDLLSAASFGDHPLAFPILGTDETLKTFTSLDLKEHMKKHYGAENIVISIAGHVDETIIQEAEQIFSSWQPSSFTPEASSQPLFSPGLKAGQKETEQAHLCLGIEGTALDDEAIYPILLLNNIFGGSMSSRLFQEVREEKGLSYSVFSYHSAYKDSGLLTVYGGTGREQVDELYETILKTMADLQRDGVTPEELISSKEQIKGGLLMGLESTSSRMSRNAKNEFLLGRHPSLDNLISRIETVTLEEVHETAEGLFNRPFAHSVISPDGQLPEGLKIK